MGSVCTIGIRKEEKVAEEIKKRIKYIKPVAMDLGGVSPILGASCSAGDTQAAGGCTPTGNGAAAGCGDGNSPGTGVCNFGNNFVLPKCAPTGSAVAP